MKLALISLGCSKNLVDGENAAGILMKDGTTTLTDRPAEADVIIVNTCGFIEQAKKESVETILSVARYKQTGKLKKLIVTGCFAQRYREELLAAMPEIDAVVGTGDVAGIAETLRETERNERVVRCGDAGFLPDADTARFLTTPAHLAYLKIAEGCDRKCTYCVIPELRGPLRSRPVGDIVREAEKLAARGVKELNLLAQETTEYGRDLYGKPSLPKLLRELTGVGGIRWIRLYYLYPASFDDELLELLKNEEKLCNYIDFPVQHISDRLLKLMGRRMTGADIRKKLTKIREALPGAAFRTSVITGFPGETAAEFKELKEFLEEFCFDYAGVFPYSREEGTPAANMPGQIPGARKEKRAVELQNLQRDIADRKNRAMLGREVQVLVDKSAHGEDPPEGRMETQAWDIDGNVSIEDGAAEAGNFVTVRLEQNFDYDFTGTIVNKTI